MLLLIKNIWYPLFGILWHLIGGYIVIYYVKMELVDFLSSRRCHIITIVGTKLVLYC